MKKLFQLDVTKEGFGGTDQPDEVSTFSIWENNNIEIMRENFQRLINAVKLERSSNKKVDDFPEYIIAKEYKKELHAERILFKDDDGKEISVDIERCFGGYWGGEIISTQVSMYDLSYEF